MSKPNSRVHDESYQKGHRIVARGLSLRARREILAQILPDYQAASGEQKRLLLDHLTQVTRYHRTYACWFLNQRK